MQICTFHPIDKWRARRSSQRLHQPRFVYPRKLGRTTPGSLRSCCAANEDWRRLLTLVRTSVMGDE